jgi:arylsulfatase A-like enzyme
MKGMERILGILLIFINLILPREGLPQDLPNIVLILADDLGFGSVGVYGADPAVLQTPNIDLLATQGRMFTNAYTPSSVCSPTRFGFLTGQYHWREGPQYGVYGVRSPLGIDEDRPTIASRLKELGYNTAAIGKWHLGYQNSSPVDYLEQLSPGPLDLGFDFHWGVPTNMGDITGVWVENDRVYGLVDSMEDLPVDQRQPQTNWQGNNMLGIPAPFRADTIITQTLNAKIDEWIDSQSADTPFFLYYPMPAIHSPHAPSGAFQGSSNGGDYADFIMEMDASVGSVLEALDRNGFAENTLVIFTSDNGGHSAGANEAVDAGLEINGNLRGLKLSIFDGGFKVPFVTKWPGQIAQGSTSNELINLVDVYATIMNLVDLEMQDPLTEAGDSYDLTEAFFGDPGEPIRNQMILKSHEGIVALIAEDFKYVEGIIADPDPQWMQVGSNRYNDEAHEQLYNLVSDPGESIDILETNPGKAAEMRAILAALREKGYSRFGTCDPESNNAPEIMASSFFVDENITGNPSIGILQASDPEGNELFYSIISGDESGVFSINPVTGQIIVKNPALLDFETTPVYTLEIEVRDCELSDIATITINVEDRNDAPTGIELSSNEIEENNERGDVIGVLSTEDPDEFDSYTYLVVSGNSRFETNGDELISKVVFDYEQFTATTVEIKSTDQGGLSVTQSFSILIIDVDDLVTGLPRNSQDDTILYPNPVDEILFFNLKGFSTATVLDITGREIISTESQTIDFSGIQSGTYIVRVETIDGNVRSFRIIKE